MKTIFQKLLGWLINLPFQFNLFTKNKAMSNIIRNTIFTVVETAIKNETKLKELTEFTMLINSGRTEGTTVNILRVVGIDRAGQVQQISRHTEDGDGLNFVNKVQKTIPKCNKVLSIEISKIPNREPVKVVRVTYEERQLDASLNLVTQFI